MGTRRRDQRDSPDIRVALPGLAQANCRPRARGPPSKYDSPAAGRYHRAVHGDCCILPKTDTTDAPTSVVSEHQTRANKSQCKLHVTRPHGQ